MTWYMQMRGAECPAIACRVRLHPSRFMCSGHLRRISQKGRLAIREARQGVARDDAYQDAIEEVGEVQL